MAKKKIQYEADAEYDVRLNLPVKAAGMTFLPLHEHQMKGALLTMIAAENPDAIGTATQRG
jgi:hypothetical protein